MNGDYGAARVFGLEKGEGNARWWGGGLATIKATGKETGGLYSIVEVLEPQGARAPLHLHRKEDEAFYVLEGETTFHIGEETIEARPGSFVFGPKDVPHTYAVDSGPARLLFLLSPAGFEGFVEATSKPAKARTLPPSESEGRPVGSACSRLVQSLPRTAMARTARRRPPAGRRPPPRTPPRRCRGYAAPPRRPPRRTSRSA